MGDDFRRVSLPAEALDLLVRHAGLRLSPADGEKIARLLQGRAARHSLSASAYCASLSPMELEQEVEALAAQVTPGETFFFRDHGQFDLLRFQLLPELIERRGRQQALRLWSAGCASGEEAYSLAMLVDMVLPKRQAWQVVVIGSDLNREALAKARLGRYGPWSFRMVPESLQARYFRHDGDAWVVADDIRQMVSFQAGNLVSAALPNASLRDMDLILCRNVLIYFNPEAVRAVVEKLAACLADAGYLVTGHTELIGQSLPGLCSRLFPEGVVYQRPRRAAAPQADRSAAGPGRASSAPAPRPAGAFKPPPASAAAEAAAAPAFATAQSLADRGQYEAAEAACAALLAADPFAPAPHFLLAQLAQLRGDYQAAEARLNQTLYLAPGHIAAYLELAALHERAGEMQRAQSRRRAALDLLRRLPADAKVEAFEATAGQLAKWLAQTGSL